LIASSATEARLPSLKLPPKAWVAPPVAPRAGSGKSAQVAEAPQLAANIVPGGTNDPGPSARLPPRPYTAPPAKAVGTGKGIDTLPPVDLPATSKDLNVAIVGLNPIDKLGPLPSAPSPATFSAGPKVNPKGSASEGGGNGIVVPDLFVRTPRDAKTDLLGQAYAAPTASETLRAAIRHGEPVMMANVQPATPSALPGAAKVSGAPDPRFNGRDVFMMAIQMPNLTSYSGSWLMWYADRTARQAGLAPIAPPVPHRKVDPKYIATAVADKVQGNVTLGCVIDTEGKVRGVELVRGLDARLNETAQEALSKWEFYPATRNGDPIEVDVIVEIPFRLAPPPPRR